MDNRRLEVALPPGLDCKDCLNSIHQRLASIPAVVMATLDATRHVAVIEASPEGPDEDHLRGLIVPMLADLSTHAAHGAAPTPKAGLPVLPTRPAAPTTPARSHDDGHDHTHDGHGHDHTHDDHDHSHDSHDHAHEHGVGEHREMAIKNRKRLLLVAAAGTLVMLTEIIGGVMANSLVLLADAGHYATDIASVLLAMLAVHWSLKPASGRKTFGHHRAEVVSAFVQAIALWGISVYFLYEAYHRLLDPPPVEGPIVFAIGALTLVANIVLAWVLHSGSGHNINMRAAYLHILSDVLGSAAALVAGALVYWKGLHIADPLLTVFITILILIFTWRLTRQSLHILLEGTPAHLDHAKVTTALLTVPGVGAVHDLHIWTHTPGMDSLTAHVVLKERPTDDRVAHAVHKRIRDEFKIDHITVQVEDPSCPCDTKRHGWVEA